MLTLAGATAGAVVAGAGAAGYGIGTWINSQLSNETSTEIGGTPDEIISHQGWLELFHIFDNLDDVNDLIQ